MGLDSYLERMPRYRGTKAKKIWEIEQYLGYQEEIKDPNSNAKNYSLKEWCGVREDNISPKALEFYKKFYTVKYYYWDDEHKYGRKRISEQIGYWRKANAIHRFFVNKVQDGIDDCEYHNEVTEEDLKELLDICYEIIQNPDKAEWLLQTCSGFFFGNTAYDEWYFEDIKETIEICENALATTDFDTQAIYYISSW